jgi:hypothetical protein
MVHATPQSFLLGATAILGIVAAAPPTPASQPKCGAQAVSVRKLPSITIPHLNYDLAYPSGLPPAFDGGVTSEKWQSFPTGFYFQPWYMVYASNPANLALRNFQYDPTPVDSSNPTGLVNDLGSFQVPNNATVYTTYGVDTPNNTYPAVFHYEGTGILEGATSEYSVLAWGCDAAELPYYVNYATVTELTKTPAGIDIMSTRETGMDQATLDMLVRKLKALGNKEIADMADGLQRMKNDGGRNGMPRITTCDDKCKSNQGLLDILG